MVCKKTFRSEKQGIFGWITEITSWWNEKDLTKNTSTQKQNFKFSLAKCEQLTELFCWVVRKAMMGKRQRLRERERNRDKDVVERQCDKRCKMTEIRAIDLMGISSHIGFYRHEMEMEKREMDSLACQMNLKNWSNGFSKRFFNKKKIYPPKMNDAQWTETTFFFKQAQHLFFHYQRHFFVLITLLLFS